VFAVAALANAQNETAGQTAGQEKEPGKYEGKYNGYGLRHGYGVFTWANGTVYKGSWSNDLMHGEGTMLFANGEKYEGYWSKGQMRGYGVYTWPNGDKYEGQFKDGQRHGVGVFTKASGEVHDGIWFNGKANGEGTHSWPDGTRYAGEWKDNLMHGQGVLVHADGTIEQGTFENGKYVKCQCATETLPATVAYHNADAVFLGKVIAINQTEVQEETIEFQVEKFWKGKLFPQRRIYLKAGFSSCDIVFIEEESYLVYAHKSGLDIYSTTKCSRTAHIGQIIGDVAVLNELACELGEEESVDQVFSRESDPVCGCDGKTYHTPYQAAKARIRSWTAGPCN